MECFTTIRVASMATVLLVASMAGCLADDAVNPDESTPPLPSLSTPLEFSAPVRITTKGQSFEPSILADEWGNLYITAAKAINSPVEGTSSWTWWSDDDGKTWKDMPSPGQVHRRLTALEGDITLDAKGRLYFVDTFAADNTLTVWQTTEAGPVWVSTRPLQGSVAADDRPWLAAHGDGIVYYIGSTAFPENPELAGTPAGSKIWFYRSTDAGLTWTPGHGFEGSGWCTIEADPRNDRDVYMACDTRAAPGEIMVYVSHDRGDTWTKETLHKIETRPLAFISIGVDREGNLYVTWIEDVAAASDRLWFASRAAISTEWAVRDVTPESLFGSYNHPWLVATGSGTVSIVWYGTPDIERTQASNWSVLGLVSLNALQRAPTWTAGNLAEKIHTGTNSPNDYLMNAFGPDNRIHVGFSYTPRPTNVVDEDANDLRLKESFYIGQVAGPNMATS